MEEEIVIQECLKINFTILCMLGLWIPSTIRGTAKGFLYKIYSVLCVFLFVIGPTLSEVIFICMVLGDIQKMIEAMFLAVTHLGWILKVYTLLRYRTRIQSLFDTLQEPIFSTVNVGSAHWVRGAMRTHYYATVFYMSMALSTVTSWMVFPFFDHNGLHLPFLAWYPFDENKSPWFTIIFMYQIVSTYYLAASNVSFDMVVPGASGMACGQLEVLCDKLEDKYSRPGQQSTLAAAKDNSVNEAVCTDTYDREVRDRLVNCVEHHMKIIGFVEETRDLFNNVAFMQFIASCVIVCCTAFKLTIDDTIGEFCGDFMYMICMLFELFVMCYFGNELILKSQRLSLAAYRCLWYNMSLQNRQYIFIIMERAKRPLQVTAVIFTLSLTTFTSVLRSSYSYYAVLKRANNR